MFAECNSNLATTNNPNFCLLTQQNWWPQDNIHHPAPSSLSSRTTTKSSIYLWQQQSNHNQQSSESSSCEEDVVSISITRNSATNNHRQFQFLLGVDDNKNSLISGESAASDYWSQLLLSSFTSGTSGSDTKNLLENSLLDGASNFSSKTCFGHDQLPNDHHDDCSFHPYSNLLERQIPINRPLNYTDNNALDPMFPVRSSHQYANQGNNGHQEMKLPRHHCGVLTEVDHCADNSTKIADFRVSFGSYLSKPLADTFNDFKPNLKTLNLCEHKKHGLQPSLTKAQGTIRTCIALTRINGSRAKEFPSVGKKKKSEDNSETYSKRQKNESSAVSSAKIQVPKVKLADKITALQQIVSPFGKTDTASVLWETINYVRFLQEQIQLLSHAYLKSSTCKERWGGFDRNSRGEERVDLRSRGLCLVPISCAPQIYHESNNGSDYLIPAYKGCLYR